MVGNKFLEVKIGVCINLLGLIIVGLVYYENKCVCGNF